MIDNRFGISTMFRCVSLLVAGTFVAACGSGEVGTSAGMDETTIMPDLPQQNGHCAMQEFIPPGGPGARYGCGGAVEGDFKFNVCTVDCDGDEEEVLIDADETVGADGVLQYGADDPTEGFVQTCCETDIQTDPAGQEEGDAACLLDCAHAACLHALERIQQMIDNPPTEMCPTPGCEQRVLESLTHWHAGLLEHFDECVQVAADPNGPSVFKLGDPPCVNDVAPAGCLANAKLHLKCTSAEIDFDTAEGTCTAAKNLPPLQERQQCVVTGAEVEITDGTGIVTSTGLGTAEATYHACTDPLCMFTVDAVSIRFDDVAWGSSDLEDLGVELVIPAPGWSDGTDLEFPAGAIQVRVLGNNVNVAGSTPFEVFTGNTVTAFGEHDDDFLQLRDVVFEAGGYTFTATIEEAECEPL